MNVMLLQEELLNNRKRGVEFIKFKIIISTIIMGLCLNIASFFYYDFAFPNEDDKFVIVGKIVSIREEKEYYDKYIVKIIYSEKYEKIKKAKIIVYIEKEYNFLPGDVVKIKGKFNKPETRKNYKGFDYSKYLKQEKIYGIIKVDEVQKMGERKDLYCIVGKIRLKILNQINELYSNETQEFLKSILIGKTDGLSEKIKEDFRNSSISHILAISGMHVSYIMFGIKSLLEKIVKNKKIRNYFLIFVAACLYFLTGESISCLRACTMFSLILIASNFYRKNNFFRTFIFSFFLILFINPYNIFNTGMWLSFMGTLGIVMFSNFLIKSFSHKYGCKNKILKFIIESLSVTISAQIFIFPIMVYTFNIISFTFFISNLLISIFIGPILIFGYVSIIFSILFPKISKIIIFLEKVLVYIILKISKICAQLPFSKIYVTTPNFFEIILIYLIIFLIFYSFKHRKFYMIKLLFSFKFLKKEIKNLIKLLKNKIVEFNENKIIEINKSVRIEYDKSCEVDPKFNSNIVRKVRFFLVLISIILIILLCNYNSNNLKINFIDVGQGDCTLIQTPKGKNILIDGGEGNSEKYDYGKNVVLPYLLDRKINEINFLIISHADSDHIGGLFAIMDSIKVDKIFIGKQIEYSIQYNYLLEVAKEKNIEICYLKAGDELNFEKEIKLEVIWPNKSEIILENALNNNSLVFKLIYNDFSILFTGDIEKLAEEKILKLYKGPLKCTILKVAHHGSKTSSTFEFIEKTSPQIVLIGVGKNNNFGHPNSEVLERLRNKRCKNISNR